jgi:hypothetical protein
MMALVSSTIVILSNSEIKFSFLSSYLAGIYPGAQIEVPAFCPRIISA